MHLGRQVVVGAGFWRQLKAKNTGPIVDHAKLSADRLSQGRLNVFDRWANRYLPDVGLDFRALECTRRNGDVDEEVGSPRHNF